MTLEEAEKQFTLEHRTAINIVGKNEIIVKKRLPHVTEKPYVSYYATEPKESFAFTGGIIGEYSNLDEVKNGFIGLSFVSDIHSNEWVISPEKG